MLFSRHLALVYLIATVVVNSTFAFIPNPVGVKPYSQQYAVNHHVSVKGGAAAIPIASSRRALARRQPGSFGALKMADEGDDMAAAVEKADALKEQAAALRAEALSAESELGRDAEPIAKKVETAAAPVIRDEDMPPQQKISDSMKDRLRRELESQGANPNKSAGNPILVVAAVVAVLVVIGGQGILY